MILVLGKFNFMFLYCSRKNRSALGDRRRICRKVPYSEKSYELASKWSELEQIKMIGIKFILVHGDGKIDCI